MGIDFYLFGLCGFNFRSFGASKRTSLTVGHLRSKPPVSRCLWKKTMSSLPVVSGVFSKRSPKMRASSQGCNQTRITKVIYAINAEFTMKLVKSAAQQSTSSPLSPAKQDFTRTHALSWPINLLLAGNWLASFINYLDQNRANSSHPFPFSTPMHGFKYSVSSILASFQSKICPNIDPVAWTVTKIIVITTMISYDDCCCHY